jgi:YD repeat-containing protein
MWAATQTTNQIGSFGLKWKSNYDERVYVGTDHFVKYATGEGDLWSFGRSSSGPGFSVAAPANVNATLVAGTTTWTLTFQNGEKRLFAIGSGLLTAIIDRNGNTTQLSYDSSSRLVTVTDAAGRHLYFTYANSSSLLVTGVSSDVGLSLSYLRRAKQTDASDQARSDHDELHVRQPVINHPSYGFPRQSA